VANQATIPSVCSLGVFTPRRPRVTGLKELGGSWTLGTRIFSEIGAEVVTSGEASPYSTGEENAAESGQSGAVSVMCLVEVEGTGRLGEGPSGGVARWLAGETAWWAGKTRGPGRAGEPRTGEARDSGVDCMRSI
jgi:hypothetical protein